uniref:Sulfotransferase family protein n=1 Tax=Desertifilum tharense IPPAS B-1220 TaxID=1781255 RepID=A0ACD5GVA3_9CYAN
MLIGMHRSGTSLTASLLQDIGVDLGDRLVGEDVGNEKGHFEDLDFVEFHKNVLRSQSLDLDGLTLADDIPVLDRYRETAQALIEENLKHRLWGWKDPRTTLFLDFWHSLLPQANFILVYRSPWEVVDSLYRRGSDELIEAYPERAVEFWMHYNQKMLEFYAKSPERCLLINLSHIVRDPSGLIAALNQKFQLQLPPPSPDIIDLSLLSDRISHSHRPVLIEKYYPEALELYRELEAKATPSTAKPSFPGCG